MKPNLTAWYALSQEWRTPDAQLQFLSVFDQAWAAVLRGCGNPQLGAAGVNCIGDRERGGKWDWFVYYRDPIAHDPAVTQNTEGAGGGTTSAGGTQSSGGASATGGGSDTKLYIGLGLLALAGLAVAFGGGD